jgi:hypothetical protein
MEISATDRSETTQQSARALAPTASTGRHEICLNGEWDFRAGEDAPERKIQVPGCWESQFSDLRGWAGSAYYERSFTVPEHFRGHRVLVDFEAVDYYTEAWVNGKHVGAHEGGYTPFGFDITQALEWEGENRLRLRVTDATPEVDVPLPDGTGMLSFAEIPHGKQSWYTPVSGIWQSVWLRAVPLVSLRRVSVQADLDASSARVRITISDGADGFHHPGVWAVRLEFTSPEGAPGIEPIELPLAEGRTEAEVYVEAPGAHSWSPEHPNLYILNATLVRNGEALDHVRTRFGFRKIETRDGLVYLNNEPYFLIGALDQAFYPRTIYTAPSEEYLRKQFIMAKEMGLNLMRCHIKVPSKRYLELCDEIGLLVWYEVPNGMQLSHAMRERVQQTFREMLDRDGNHPCIVIKTIMNESWGIDLDDPEQRDWLIKTFHWAKQLAPDKLIVDNSACIPNFHVISDLDDYHIYFNIPDQADDFAEWVSTFAGRTAGSYSGFGDATRRNTEPLVISEFGNWGLPRYDKIIEAEGGVPYWFKTGAGITCPDGLLNRFERHKLHRAFEDYNDLAEASQEQEWIALKFQIEEMRRHREVAGYVITEFSDINWEPNGLLDFGRNPKVFYGRLGDLQQQDIVIPRPERHAYWSGEDVVVETYLSRFSARDTAGATVHWSILGLEGEFGAEYTPRSESCPLGAVRFSAPDVDAPLKADLLVTLRNNRGEVLGRSSAPLVFAPRKLQRWGEGRSVWLHDPPKSQEDLAERFEKCGFRVLAEGDPVDDNTLGIITCWDSEAHAFLQNGGKGVLVTLHPKSLPISSGLSQRLQERALNNWWGDWCSSQTWFVPSAFPYLPDTRKLGFEYKHVIPKRVLSGASADNTLSGIFVGWLHNGAAYVVRQGVGQGRLVTSTFDVLSHFHDDPISTLMLASFAEQLM